MSNPLARKQYGSSLSTWLTKDIPNHHEVQITYRFPATSAHQVPVPLAGVAYKIVCLQDERIEFSGQLDERGQARHDGLIPGPIAIHFAAQDLTTQRLAANKLRESIKQSLDSLAMLLTSQKHQLQQVLQTREGSDLFPYGLPLTNHYFFEVVATNFLHCSGLQSAGLQGEGLWENYCEWFTNVSEELGFVSTSNPLHNAEKSPAIVGNIFGAGAPAVLKTLGRLEPLSDKVVASTFLLLSDKEFVATLNGFISSVWQESSDCPHVCGFLLDLINSLVIDVLMEEEGLVYGGGNSLLALCVELFPSATLLIEDAVKQIRELVTLFGQVKMSVKVEAITNTAVDIVWQEPPTNQRSLSHYSNVALLPINQCGDPVALGEDNLIDQSFVQGVTGEVVLAHEDFYIKGPIPLAWKRHYRSSNSCGWSSLENEKLQVSKGMVDYYQEDGLVVRFELPPVGKYSTNVTTGQLLQRTFCSVFVVKNAGPTERIFCGRCSVALPATEIEKITTGILGQSTDIEETITLTQISDQNGHHWDLDYRNEQLIGLSSSWGAMLILERDVNGGITKIIGRLGEGGNKTDVLAHYQWSSRRLIAVESLHGSSWQYEYISSPNKPDSSSHHHAQSTLLSRLQALGSAETKFHWLWQDQRWRCVEVSSAIGVNHKFQYHPQEKAVVCLSSQGGVVRQRWLYDKQGLVRQKIQGDGSYKTYQYNANHHPVACTDAENNITQYRYSLEGFLTSKIDPAGGGYSLGYDGQGRLQEVCNALGESWGCEYDALGAVKSLTNSLGLAFRINCIAGLPVSLSTEGQSQVNGGADLRRYWQWDDYANLITNSGSGKLNQAEYDRFGNLVKLSDRGSVVVDIVRDEKLRLRQVLAEGRVLLATNYHSTGFIEHLEKTDEDSVRIAVDDYGRVLTWREMSGQCLSIEYDAEGRISQLFSHGASASVSATKIQLHYEGGVLPAAYVDARGRLYNIGFDRRGLMISCEDKELVGREVSSNRQWQYDACGRQILCSDANNEMKTQYDALGRIVEHLVNDELIQCAYHPQGALAHYSSPNGTVDHEYDAYGFRVKTTFSRGFVVDYCYDVPGILSRVLINGSEVLEIFRDTVGVEEYRQQGAFKTQSPRDDINQYVDGVFDTLLKQTCSQMNVWHQREFMPAMQRLLQLSEVIFPPLLQRAVNGFVSASNSQRELSQIPEETQLADGSIVIAHPVSGQPLLCILQNQMHFYDRSIDSGWRDWHGNEMAAIDVACINKVSSTGLRDSLIDADWVKCVPGTDMTGFSRIADKMWNRV